MSTFSTDRDLELHRIATDNRRIALAEAARNNSQGSDPKTVLETARKYERFLSGEGTPGDNVKVA